MRNIKKSDGERKSLALLGHKELAEALKTKYSIDEIAKKLCTTPETVRLYIQKYGLLFDYKPLFRWKILSSRI